jgi:TRAP-type uncharacterized transport system substrate-binding protein
MKNKLAITMVALMVVALAVPAVMAADYTVTVLTGQNTAVTSIDGDFSSVYSGSVTPKSDSVILKNSGDQAAKVTASGNDFIVVATPTNTFPIESLTINTVSVTNTGAVVIASVPADNVDHAYDQELTIPAAQAAGAYTTSVTLAFGNAV